MLFGIIDFGFKRAMESGSEHRSTRLLPFEAKSQLASPRPEINQEK
jgi:hypothetical protein